MTSNAIYKITNSINDNFYIGKTTIGIHQRFKRHLSLYEQGHTHLYRAMKLYGIENFSISIIEFTTQDLLNEKEKFWISELLPTYNMTIGGDGGNTSNSINYIKSMMDYHSKKSPSDYATYGMLGKKQSEKFLKSIKLSNSCPVMCNGIEYSSINEAEKDHVGINLRKRLDNPKYPEFYRLKEKIKRNPIK